MTAPVLDFDWPSWRAARAAEHDSDVRSVWLLDKDMLPLVPLNGLIDGECSDRVNTPGDLRVTIPGEHPAVPVLLMVEESATDPQALLDEWMWIVVETQHYRLTYRLVDIELLTEDGDLTVTVIGEGLWAHLNHLPLWASPNLPLVAQLKYADVQAGDSLRVLKGYLHRNLAREFQPSAVGSWGMWDASTWQEKVTPEQWPIIVNPIHESLSTEWTVLDSRFNIAGPMFKDTLDAAGLLLTVDLWLPGDEQPFPSHGTLTQPTIVIDIVPRAFDSGSTGRPTDLLRGLRATIAGDQTTKAIVLDDSWFSGTNPHAWCVWSADHMLNTSHRLVIRKSTDSSVIVGGRSPQIVNSLIAAGSNALWQGIGAAVAMLFPPLAPLAVAAGAFIGHVQGELLKDKLFAWMGFNARTRQMAHGRFRYRAIVRSGEGFSLSGLQQGFTALQATQGSISTEFTVGDGYPYVFGRDFRAGDQAGFISHGIAFATYVEEVRVDFARGGDTLQLGLGDPRLRESPARSLSRSLTTAKNVVDRIATAIP